MKYLLISFVIYLIIRFTIKVFNSGVHTLNNNNDIRKENPNFYSTNSRSNKKKSISTGDYIDYEDVKS